MNKKFFLSISSGILLALPWQEVLSGVFVFFALLPLLFLENYFFKNKKENSHREFFGYVWLSFAIWNLLSFWWAYQPTILGIIAPTFLNSLFYALFLWLAHIIKRKLGENYGNFSIIAFWIAFEYLHHNWDFSFPWLSLGNALAKEIWIIQWYEFTGILGGSLWVILTNMLITSFLLKAISKPKNKLEIRNRNLHLATLISILVLPLTVSLVIFLNYKENGKPVNITIVQPNFNPYTQKFDNLSAQKQIEIMLNLADSTLPQKTDFIIFPETSITKNINEAHLDSSKIISPIKKFIKQKPEIEIVIGAYTFQNFTQNSNLKIPKSATKIEGSNTFIDYYNSALFFSAGKNVESYNKSKLLLGVEKMPFQSVFKFVKKLKINIAGGVTWYGTQPETSVFLSQNDSIKIATAICWESVFGEYLSKAVAKDADFIAVITNDGWWGNTPAHRLHMRMSQIRAIENRRSIARSANTGISCFINQRGEILQKTKYNEKTAIQNTIFTNKKQTFYTRTGDMIGKIGAFMSVLLILAFFVKTKTIKT